jgi:hypothetical protein
VGVTLENVLSSVAEWRSGGPPAGGSNGDMAPKRESGQKTEAEIIEQNNRALAELQRMMPGLGV